MIHRLANLEQLFVEMLAAVQVGDWTKVEKLFADIEIADLPGDRMQHIPEYGASQKSDLRYLQLRDNVRKLKDTIKAKDAEDSERLIVESRTIVTGLRAKER